MYAVKQWCSTIETEIAMKYYIKTCYYMPKIRKQIGHISGKEMVEMPLSALESGPLTPDAAIATDYSLLQ